VAKRERRQHRAELSARKTFLEARAALDSFKERVRQGLVAPPTPAALEIMEREVLALLK